MIYSLYNGEIQLEFDENRHVYTVDGRVAEGVTTILGVINKPALVYWSANKAAEYINLNLPVGKVIDEIEKKKLVDGCKRAHKTLKTDAGDLGTFLHGLIEKFAKKEPYDEPVNAILKHSFSQFQDWVKQENVVFKLAERKIYSRKYGYAGTLDLTAKVGGVNALIDIKTSSGIWNEYFLQCAAYRQALMEEFPRTKISKTIIVRCGKDGAFEVKEANDFKENIEAFVAALTLHRRLKRMEFEAKHKEEA